MKFCLRCGKAYNENDTRITCMCGLEIEIREGYIPMTRYHNIFDLNWKYVPDGCLLILKEIQL